MTQVEQMLADSLCMASALNLSYQMPNEDRTWPLSQLKSSYVFGSMNAVFPSAIGVTSTSSALLRVAQSFAPAFWLVTPDFCSGGNTHASRDQTAEIIHQR